MKKFYILFFAFLGASSLSYSQLCPALGPDQLLPCGVSSTTLVADFSNCPPGGAGPKETTTYTVNSIPYSPEPIGGTAVNNWSNGDDGVAGPFNIGFSFCFYGNTYTQFYIGTNGWVSFSAGQSTAFVTNSIPSTNAAVPKNCIMGPWQDWYPGIGGQVRYQVLGTAPCRRLVVTWSNVPMYLCTNVTGSFQIVLFESSNKIQNHIINKQACNGWYANNATQGLHNLGGTAAVVVPGRNSTSWTASNESYEYLPNGNPVNAILTWYQVGNPVPIGYGPTLTVTPTVGTQYTCHPEYPSCFAGWKNCNGGGGGSGPDTVLVVPGPPLPVVNFTGGTDFCPGASITIGTSFPYTDYLWSDGSNGPTYTTNVPGPVAVTVTDGNGCQGSGLVVLNQYPQPVVGVNPVDPYICPGDTVQLNAFGAVTYLWSPAYGLDITYGSTVNASPLVNTFYTIIGTDVNGCNDTITNNVYLNTPPSVSIALGSPSACVGGSVQLTASGANTYVWSPAAGLDDPAIYNPVATLFSQATYTVIGTDATGCRDTTSATINVDPLPNVNFASQNNNGCEPLTVDFQNNSTVSQGSISYYQWVFESNGTSAGQNPTTTFNSDGTYDVTLIATTDAGCADSLTIQDFVNVYNIPTASFTAAPQPIVLGAGPINFTNTSSSDVNQWNWDFAGLGSSTASDPNYTFAYADSFLVTLVVSTQYGCMDTTQQMVYVDDVSLIFIPNSFSPNEDGLNDVWFPVGRGLNSKEVSILVHVYNRWGKLVFVSGTSDKPWNGYDYNMGSECPVGSYVYDIEYTNQQGESFSYRGSVSILK